MSIHSITFLLIVAALTALAARRLHVPYTVGLVLVGTALSLLHAGGSIAPTRHLLYYALLPPLLFEAAISLPWDAIRRDAIPILTLAVFGVAISAFVVAYGMTLFAHWPWKSAFVFGALIAATDPVSVLATFKETGVKGRLRILVESESLLNDGMASVLYALAVAYAVASTTKGSAAPPDGLALSLVWEIVGGVLAGGLCGIAAVLLAGRSTADHMIETVLTAVAAYGSFLLADDFGASGVLATLTAGLVMGNYGALHKDNSRFFSNRGRDAAEAFWEFAAFLANSMIFLLIGFGNAQVRFDKIGFMVIAVAISLVWFGRAASVYPLCALFRRTSLRISARHQHALFWGGLRGALALALALSLPATVPYQENIRVVTFAVVVFSVIVQGIAMPFWLRHWGLLPSPETKSEPVDL